MRRYAVGFLPGLQNLARDPQPVHAKSQEPPSLHTFFPVYWSAREVQHVCTCVGLSQDFPYTQARQCSLPDLKHAQSVSYAWNMPRLETGYVILGIQQAKF